jgi:hypothetical protein
MGPQPAQIRAHVLSPLAATALPGIRFRGVLAHFRRVIESPLFVILQEKLVSLTRRARMTHQMNALGMAGCQIVVGNSTILLADGLPATWS